MNLKSIAKRHGFETSDFDDVFYEALKLVYKVNNRANQDLHLKYFMDNLQEMANFSESELDYIVKYYLEDYFNTEYSGGKSDNFGEEYEEDMRKPMQTSVGMSNTIGMSRPTGYKTKVINTYGEK